MVMRLEVVLVMCSMVVGSVPAVALGQDCNGNGVADAKDIAGGFSEDCQADGVPDECQIAEGEIRYAYDDGIYGGAVGTDFTASLGWLLNFTVEPGFEVVNGIELAYGVAPEGHPVEVGIWSDPNGDGDPSDGVLLNSIETTVQSPWLPVTIISLEFPETVVGNAGDSFFIGVWGANFPPVPDGFPAPYDTDSTADRSWWIEKAGPIDPADLSADALEFGLISDILPGLVGDWLIRGTYCGTGFCNASQDVDGNGVPDECDPDCDGNGIPDGADIAGGAPDCNGNGVLDVCEPPSEDCDANGIPDDCQRAPGAFVGEYFRNVDFAGDAIARLDAGVFFDFDDPGARPTGIPVNDFSARWTGVLTPEVGGTYEIGLRHDDGVRLFIDGAIAINRWGPSGGDLDTVIVDWVAGERHHIRIDYYQGGGGALVEFVWRLVGDPELVAVPAALMAPSIDVDGDGVADICGVPDCNGNLVPDLLEIEAGGDCDGDGRLDACEADDDCNANGVPDGCEGLETGLFGEYYVSEGGTGFFTVRSRVAIDPVIDFDWQEGGPEGVPVDSFSVAWSGSVLTTDVAGTYRFVLDVDDGLRFWVDGDLLIELWTANANIFEVEVELEANRAYPIRLEMFELGGSAKARLLWEPPGGSLAVIPTENLLPYPDADGDGLDDRCASDCDGDGLSDAIAIMEGEPDCDGNGVPDACDLAAQGVAPSIARWRFEGTGNTAEDEGGLGLDASLTNVARQAATPNAAVPLTDEANAGSLAFGNGARMVVSDPSGVLALGGDAFTIEGWVRLDELADTSGNGQRQWLACRKPVGGDELIDWGALVQGGNYPASCRDVYGGPVVRNGRELVFTGGEGVGDSSFKWAAVSTMRIEDTDWHHVAFSVDLQQRVVRFALDGMVENVPLGKRYFPSGGGPLRIGCHVNASGAVNQFLRGSLDELRVSTGLAQVDRLLDFPYAPVAVDEDEDGIPDGCVEDCPGDLDGDGLVGGADLGQLLLDWGSCAGCAADLTRDGVVDGADFGSLLVGWGACP